VRERVQLVPGTEKGVKLGLIGSIPKN